MTEAIGARGIQGGTQPSQPCWTGTTLGSFLDRASLCGDMTSALQLLASQDDALSSATQRKQLHIRRRLVDDAHVRKQKELEKYYRALKRTSFWSRVGKIFGGICGALSIVSGGIFGLASLPTIAIGAVGALGTGGASLGAAEWNRKATAAKASQLLDQLAIDQGKQVTEQLVDDIQKTAEIEGAMIARLSKFADSEAAFQVR